MADTERTVARIDALESRVAYQDDAIENLSKTIAEQWQQIDMLTRQIANLKDRLQEAETQSPAMLPNEPPPPHY